MGCLRYCFPKLDRVEKFQSQKNSIGTPGSGLGTSKACSVLDPNQNEANHQPVFSD